MLWVALAVALEIPAEEHGVVLGVGRATVMGVYLLMHLVPVWHYRFGYSVAAQVLGLGGMLLVCVGNHAAALATGVVLLSVLLGYNYFASLFYNRSGHGEAGKGAAFGLNEAFLSLGAGGGSLLGGWAATGWGERGPFQIAAVVIALGLVAQVETHLASPCSWADSSTPDSLIDTSRTRTRCSMDLLNNLSFRCEDMGVPAQLYFYRLRVNHRSPKMRIQNH